MGRPAWHVLIVAGLAFGSVARITRFLTADDLAAPIRSWVVHRYGAQSKAATFTECPWCVSIWVAAPVAPLAVWAAAPALGGVTGVEFAAASAGTWLTLSYFCGFVSARETPAS